MSGYTQKYVPSIARTFAVNVILTQIKNNTLDSIVIEKLPKETAAIYLLTLETLSVSEHGISKMTNSYCGLQILPVL